MHVPLPFRMRRKAFRPSARMLSLYRRILEPVDRRLSLWQTPALARSPYKRRVVDGISVYHQMIRAHSVWGILLFMSCMILHFAIVLPIFLAILTDAYKMRCLSHDIAMERYQARCAKRVEEEHLNFLDRRRAMGLVKATGLHAAAAAAELQAVPLALRPGRK